jgi:hypothetical protein
VRDDPANPWTDLPGRPPYVLECDRTSIERFNTIASDQHRIRLEIVPEPFLGEPSAPVVLLNLNTGFVESDKVVHLGSVFNEAARANLEHRHEACPFYLLDPALPSSPGRGWWMKKLRALIAARSLETVATRVFVVEIHGYHSKQFSRKLRLASQDYSRALVIRALKRGLRSWSCADCSIG